MEKTIVRDIFFLKQKCTEADAADLPIVQDLSDTFRAHRHHCAGMAANMIGHAKRIIIADCGGIVMVMLNPVITNGKKPYETEEGCLSLDGTRRTKRWQEITVSWQDISLQHHTRKFTGFAAQVLQHEIDHLSGIII